MARQKAVFLLVSTTVLVTLALIQGAQEPSIVHVDVYLKGLPSTADGYVIVQVSDLHIGAVIGHRFISRLVERVNTLGAGTAWRTTAVLILCANRSTSSRSDLICPDLIATV
mgnify:CR=1 FL=1